MTKEEKQALGIVFGGNLRRVRGSSTQQDMAAYLGVGAQVTYLRYEKGRLPRRSILIGIASKFGITESDLTRPLSDAQIAEIRGFMAAEELLSPSNTGASGAGNAKHLRPRRFESAVPSEAQREAAILRNPGATFAATIAALPTGFARGAAEYFKALAASTEDDEIREIENVVALEIYAEIMRRDQSAVDEILRDRGPAKAP